MVDRRLEYSIPLHDDIVQSKPNLTEEQKDKLQNITEWDASLMETPSKYSAKKHSRDRYMKKLFNNKHSQNTVTPILEQHVIHERGYER